MDYILNAVEFPQAIQNLYNLVSPERWKRQAECVCSCLCRKNSVTYVHNNTYNSDPAVLLTGWLSSAIYWWNVLMSSHFSTLVIKRMVVRSLDFLVLWLWFKIHQSRKVKPAPTCCQFNELCYFALGMCFGKKCSDHSSAITRCQQSFMVKKFDVKVYDSTTLLHPTVTEC